jgi:hypothetical protein
MQQTKMLLLAANGGLRGESCKHGSWTLQLGSWM